MEKAKFEHAENLIARVRDNRLPPQALKIWLAGNSGGSGWFFRKFNKVGEIPAGWHGVRVPTKENARNLIPGYERQLRATFSKEKARLYLDAGEADSTGMVYPMFDQDKHVLKCHMLTTAMPKVVAVDPGLDHPCAAVWAALLPNGVVHVYDEHKERGLTIAHNIARMKSRIMETHHKMFVGKARAGAERYPGVDDFAWVIDPSARKRSFVTKERDIDEWRRLGLPVLEAENRKAIGVDIVRRLMEEVAEDGLPKFRVDPRCRNLIEELANIRTDDDEGDDVSDCVRYACAYLILMAGGQTEESVSGGVPGEMPVSYNYLYDAGGAEKEYEME